jgi:hypothetical protein
MNNFKTRIYVEATIIQSIPGLDIDERVQAANGERVCHWWCGRADLMMVDKERMPADLLKPKERIGPDTTWCCSRGSDSLSGHRGRYSGPMLRGGWRYGGRRRW